VNFHEIWHILKNPPRNITFSPRIIAVSVPAVVRVSHASPRPALIRGFTTMRYINLRFTYLFTLLQRI